MGDKAKEAGAACASLGKRESSSWPAFATENKAADCILRNGCHGRGNIAFAHAIRNNEQIADAAGVCVAERIY